jgi:predicted MFS family arabinose efflux permease
VDASGEVAVAIEKPSAARAGANILAPIVFLVLLCLAYSINAADRQIFPTLLPAIRQTFAYDLKVAGLLSTIFTLGLAVAGLPTGYVVDRTSRKTIILLAMVIYSVFTLATIYAYGFWDMLFYRAMTGVGEGMQMAALFAAIGSYFHRRRSFFIGWLIVAYGVGAFLGPRLGSMLAEAAGNWQTPFVWFAFTGWGIAAIVLVFVPKDFTESKGPEEREAIDQAALAHMPAGLWNRNVILGIIGCIILGYSLYGFIGLYTTYLREGLLFSQADAAAAFSFFGLGGLVSFAGGWCGDRFSQRFVTAIAFGLLAVVGYAMYNWSTSLQSQSVLSFLTGALASGFAFVNLLSMLQRSVRPHMVGRASGVFLTCLVPAPPPAIFWASWSAPSAGAALP